MIILFALWCILMIILGAIAHERDMARNYKREGDARAWTTEIKKESEKT